MFYPISRRTLFPFIRFFIKKTFGLEHVPLQGPYLIACKHLGPLDGVFIGAVLLPHLKQKIAFISNTAPWGWYWEKIVAERWANCIPFHRENPHASLDIADAYLKNGKIVGIFPEGIIQEYNEEKMRAKTGTARLAIWNRVPIIPVGMVHDVTVRPDLPKLHRRRQVIRNILYNPHALEIHIGKPFELTQYYDREMTKEVLIEATNMIMDRIDGLTHINRNP